MQTSLKINKAGVSLIAVLLFMLIATIAATATWKWITSEGFSSTSRMLKREAYQSSMAGIENARTWMTFHGNDVGALIKAYLDGGNKPINLDSRLRPLQRAGQNYHVWLVGVNTEKSTYKLKIMSSGESRGDSKHNETAIFNVDGLYQVKIPQSSASVAVPFEYNYFGGSTTSQGHIKAHALLINGDLNGTNPVYADASLIVTGNANVTGSSIGAGKNVCIGGNLDANNGVFGGDFYVEGNADNFTFPTTSEAAGVTNANVTGNVYINGNLGSASTGDQKFQKNLTLNGVWTTNLGAHEASVAKNFCLGPNGQVLINAESRIFQVGENVYSKSKFPIWRDGAIDNHGAYDKIVLGQKQTSQVLISTAHPSADYVTLRNDRTFNENSKYQKGNNMMMYGATSMWDDRTYQPYPAVTSADDKYYLYDYSGSGQDVDYVVTSTPWGWSKIYYANYYVGNKVFYTPANGYVGTPWYTEEKHSYLPASAGTIGSPICGEAAGDKWRPTCYVTPWFKSNGTISRTVPDTPEFDCAESAKDFCDDVWHEADDGCDNAKYKVDDVLTTAYSTFSSYANKGCEVSTWNNDLSNILNRCYQTNSTDPALAEENLYNGYQVVSITGGQKSDPTTPLRGKFIIIVTDQLGQQSLPPTTADSYVLLYLTNGASSTIQPAVNNGIYNYFVYTEHDISGFMFNDAVFSGSIYATAASCAKVGDFKTREMVFNEALLTDLASNGILCETTAASCGGVVNSSSSVAGSSSSAGAGGAVVASGMDSHYISMAPQISVTLESQYKSKEALPTASAEGTTALNGSFIVLPRIVYLSDDPFGKLSDYYNIQPLNGAALTKSGVSVNCSGPNALNTTGQLYSTSSAKLAHGIYTCTASAGTAGYDDVPFWVVVGASSRGTPAVTFLEDSYEMPSTYTKEVKLHVPARGADMVVNVYCPEMPNEQWKYTSYGTGVTKDGSDCKVALSAGAATDLTIFTISTTSAVVGTATFQIMPGEGYIPGSIPSTELFIAANAYLNRSSEVSSEEIEAYCDAHASDCPTGYATSWPNCNTSALWVEPAGVSYSRRTDNLSWTILVGNTSPVTLQKVSNFDECVVIIPSGTDNSIATVEANRTYTLRAIAKAKAHSLKVGFVGNVGTGNNPVIEITAGGRSSECIYSAATADEQNAQLKTCTVNVFSGESISLKMRDDTNAEKFNYWKCSGGSCPIAEDENITSKEFTAFTVSDNATSVIARFGESDKHCFFDEFKKSNVECSSDQDVYCIDRCGNGDDAVCTGATDESGSPSAKWHLVSGELGQIETGSSGEIHAVRTLNKKKKESDRTSVKVMSSVTAGLLGSLKALVNVPRATSTYGRSSETIKNSGFMLRSNDYGTDYFMLNLYENTSGHLEAQLWKGSTSFADELTNKTTSAPVSVSNYTMVMATATLTADNKLEVKAFVGNYYNMGDTPTEYTHVFDLSLFNTNLADAAHQYVGYSLADPSFKIYGVGWKSDSYNSSCHDTYPTVKCSFAAVAVDGVVKTGETVQPWVGHSGWYDSKSCTPVYYYYNGADASATCGPKDESGAECSGGYLFTKHEHGVTTPETESNGLHGYTDENGKDVKTAKAWLSNCTTTGNVVTATAWGIATAEQRAHCGVFWTGKFEECKEHKTLMPTDKVSANQSVEAGTETTITLEPKQKLRGATLHITLDNDDNNEVEIWLVSETPGPEQWGEGSHESHSVKMTGSKASFEVMRDLATGSDVFDPEEVKQIVFKNHGNSTVYVKSITSTCANAIGITSCRAEYNGTSWEISTQVTNKNAISSYEVVATVDNDQIFKVEKTSDQIVWNGDMAYMQKEDDPYESNQGKHYVFEATVKGTATQTATKACSVSPDPIGSVNVTCSVNGTVASGARFPTFNIEFSGCPGDGCAYEVYLDAESTPFAIGTGKTSARHSANQTEQCSSASGCEHTYTVKSVSDGIPFTDCSASFKVVRDVNNVPPTVQCGISRDQWNFTTGTKLSTDDLYFIARNEESVEKTYEVTLYKDDAELGSATLKNWSQMTQVMHLGTLSAGTHTYSLYAMGEKICEETVEVSSSTVTCEIYDASGNEVKSVAPRTSNLKFTVSHDVTAATKTGFSGTVMEWVNGVATDVEKDKVEFWLNPNQDAVWTFESPLAAGSYTYSVSLHGSKLCEADLTVLSSPLTCTAPAEVNPGEQFTMSGSYYGTCYYADVKIDNQYIGAVPCNTLSTTLTAPTTTGTYTYKLTVGEYSCEKDVVVRMGPPSFRCPENMTRQVGTSVAITPENVTGCDGGCSYAIEEESISGTSYTGGALTSFTAPSSSNADAVYTVSLTNTSGTTSHECHIKFTNCGCTCSSGCHHLQTNSVSGTQYAKQCIFATSITQINENYGQNVIKVNGVRPGYCYDSDQNSQNYCTNVLANIPKIAGGYYIEIPITNGCTKTSNEASNCEWLAVDVSKDGAVPLPTCE